MKGPRMPLSVDREQAPLLITNVHLVDVENERILEGQCVLVEDGLICHIGERAGPDRAQVCRVIDGKGRYLLPGLIDLHVHLMFDARRNLQTCALEHSVPALTVNALSAAQKALASGYTTVRDLGASAGIAISLGERVESGVVQGPRIVASGQILTASGGHASSGPNWLHQEHPFGFVANGSTELLRAVRQQVSQGAQVIKFSASSGMSSAKSSPFTCEYSLEEMKAIVDEAHMLGLRVSAHAHGETAIARAIAAGVDTVEHGTQLTELTIRQMVASETALVPTLSAIHAIVDSPPNAGIPEETRRKASGAKQRRIESFQKALSAGVCIGAGSDAGTPFNHHGSNAHELELLVRFGMSPSQAIRAATVVAAGILGMEDRIGTIAIGKEADMILVDRNPMDDVGVLASESGIVAVIKGGQPVA